MSIGKNSIARAAQTAHHTPDNGFVPAALPHPIMTLDPNEILLLPDDPRSEAVPSAALLRSVQANGVLEPLLLAVLDGKRYLIAGHQRLAAAKALALRTVPALLHPVTDLDAAQRMAAELRPFAVTTIHEEKWKAVSAIRSDLPPYLL